MKKYEQLIEGQRYQIYALKKAGQTNKEITLIVRTSESTLYREFQRNTGKRGYRPKQAQIFASHETMNKELDMQVYFAPPYRSWERGLNENTNGLIMQN